MWWTHLTYFILMRTTMNIQFLFHMISLWCIFYILTTWARIFLNLRWSIDFSYLGIVIFGAYAWALCNTQWGRGIFASVAFAFVLSLVFTFVVLYLSTKLEWLYFTIGTLTLYMLLYQLSYNAESLTGWAFGLTWMTRELWRWLTLASPLQFLLFALSCALLVVCCLMYFKKTYVYKVLQWWGERHMVIKSLWTSVSRYKLLMICITTFLAVLGGNLYSFFIQFIDPNSFWLPMLVLLLVLLFWWYKLSEFWTLCFCLLVVWLYEYLRFFKVVDASQIGYFREIVFAILILMSSFWIFKRQKQGVRWF